MGSPTVIYQNVPLAGGGIANSEPVGDRNVRNLHSRSGAKRFRNDVPSTYQYEDNCRFVDATPKLSLMIQPYGVPRQSFYRYPAPSVPDAVLVAPQLNFPPAHPEFHDDVYQLERRTRNIKLDGQSGAALVAHADVLLPAPPSTPSSTISDTDMSSPRSFVSMHLAGSDTSSVSDKPSRQRANSGGSFYRTKPCKFFHTNGMCVKGNRCNFIHDQSQARRPPQSPDASSSTTSRRRRAARRTQARAEDAEEQSNFYPIMWRVIGGGVMMGGHRELCQAYLAGECNEGSDCKFSHPVEEDDELYELSDVLTPSCYKPTELFSPISPIYLNHPFVLPPPLPQVPDVSFPSPTIIEVRNAPEEPAALDGATLLPRENTVAADTVTPTPGSPSTDNALLSARTIVRPVSTPPATKASTVSFARLFQAESSW